MVSDWVERLVVRLFSFLVGYWKGKRDNGRRGYSQNFKKKAVSMIRDTALWSSLSRSISEMILDLWHVGGDVSPA